MRAVEGGVGEENERKGVSRKLIRLMRKKNS
jgi:hypothetical protein